MPFSQTSCLCSTIGLSRQALAVHFDNIQSLAERVDRYFQFKLGGYQHAGSSGSTTDALKDYLLNRMAALDDEAADLDARVALAVASLVSC
jgi:hypothetical protein